MEEMDQNESCGGEAKVGGQYRSSGVCSGGGGGGGGGVLKTLHGHTTITNHRIETGSKTGALSHIQHQLPHALRESV